MRILLVSTSSGSRGGGELALLPIGESLSAQGHEILLWCATHPRMDELAEKFQPIGEVRRSPYPNSYYDRKTRCLGASLDRRLSRRIAGEWRQIAPDVIHLNKQNLEDGLDLVLAANLAAIPAVCMIHITQSASWLGARFGGLRDWIACARLRKFKGPFVTTPDTRAKTLRALIGGDQAIHVIDNGVRRPSVTEGARARCREDLAVSNTDLLFITLGRMEPQKQPLEMLEIAGACARARPGKVKFVWVGSGSMEDEWRAKRQSLGLEGCVHHIPWTDHPGDWLSAAEAMLHPAKFEGMPFAVLEALALGLPVCMLPELIAEIPPFKAPGIVEIDGQMAWLDELLDPERRPAISTDAFRLHASRFSLAGMGARYQALYLDCIGPPRS